MILDKYVEIIGNSKNIKYYTEKGYEIDRGIKILVKTEDLSNGSTFKVNIQCDKCKVIKKIEWGTYLKYVRYDLNESYSCINCVVEKRLKTNNIKYGGNSPTCSKKIVDKIKKTNLEKYGNVCSLHGINQQKTESIFLEKYGFKTPLKNNSIKDKIKESMINKYGYVTFLGSNLHKEKNIIYMSNKYNLNIIDSEKKTHTIICSNCNKTYEISSNNIYRRHKNYTDEKYICTICNPIGSSYSSSYESIICDFLDKYNVTYIKNDQCIIKPYHIDIYLPDYNLGIEFNGLYWHSELKKDKRYHLKKYELCLNEQINLLQIWEDDWKYKSEIIKSIILEKLNLTPNKINYTNCKIKEVRDIKSTKEFLNENHIEGYLKCSIHIGAYFNNELVSLMTFKKIKEDYELIRFCSKINFDINNIDVELFNYFKANYFFNKIIAYSDNTLSNGELYKKLDFIYKKTYLRYYWSDFNMKYTKPNTNKEIAKIWNAGNRKWIYELNNHS